MSSSSSDPNSPKQPQLEEGLDGKHKVTQNADYDPANASSLEDVTFQFDDSRKLGTTGAVFLILNKMIGTGSMFGARPCDSSALVNLIN